MIKTGIEKIYGISAEGKTKRVVLTPIVGGIFAVVTALFVIVPVRLEIILKFPPLWHAPLSYVLSSPFIIIGIFLMAWTSLIFFLRRGTPVPVNPPAELVVKGPYRYIRNPMHLGLFLLMFGLGIYYSSILSVAVFTPLYILFDVTMLRKIEEPDLVKRLGDSYIAYRKNTPMFFPWKRR